MSNPKKPKAQSARCLLYPSRQGWALQTAPSATPVHFSTLEEAAAALPADLHLTVALRPSRVLVERFVLPSTDPTEVHDMVALQLEKMLPYPIEETALETSILHVEEASAIVVATVAKIGDIEEEFEAVTARGIYPAQLILLASAVTASSPVSTTVSVFSEGNHIALLIGEGGKLAFAQTMSSGAVGWDSEIAQWMLAAEIAGANLEGAAIRLEAGLENLAPALTAAFGRTPETFEIQPPFDCPPSTLLPKSWETAKAARGRAANLRKRIALAAYAYIGFILAIVGFLVILRLRVDNVERQVRAILPETQRIMASSARWNAMAAVVDQSRHPVETLLQMYDSRPADDVLITNFDQTPTEVTVRGEAPSLEKAYQFLDTFKSREGLPFQLNYNPPASMGDKVQFLINGGAQ